MHLQQLETVVVADKRLEVTESETAAMRTADPTPLGQFHN